MPFSTPNQPELNQPELNQLLRFRPWPPGDPFVLVETILQELPGNQRQQALNLYLQSIVSIQEANLQLVKGLQQLVGRAATGQGASAG
jgi:hypothetical protein